MDIFGYIASIFIGISLGLIGGGGSILTLPVLVYIFCVNAVSATAYSLFIVGITSAVGSIAYFKNGLVDIKTAIVFGLPAIISVYLTRAYIVTAIPNNVFIIGNFVITKSVLIMLLFAMLMITAAYSMIKKGKKNNALPNLEGAKFKYHLILFEGAAVGVLTGLVGAGGGFLIVPALVVLSMLPIKKAVGTSLLIIAAKSLIGFLGQGSATLINWGLLLSVSAFAVVGICIGAMLATKVDGDKLKPAFGWFCYLWDFV